MPGLAIGSSRYIISHATANASTQKTCSLDKLLECEGCLQGLHHKVPLATRLQHTTGGHHRGRASIRLGERRLCEAPVCAGRCLTRLPEGQQRCRQACRTVCNDGFCTGRCSRHAATSMRLLPCVQASARLSTLVLHQHNHRPPDRLPKDRPNAW